MTIQSALAAAWQDEDFYNVILVGADGVSSSGQQVRLGMSITRVETHVVVKNCYTDNLDLKLLCTDEHTHGSEDNSLTDDKALSMLNFCDAANYLELSHFTGYCDE
eukprot:scaffold2256_cov166-Amphora_coffeaeformis.AAC.21